MVNKTGKIFLYSLLIGYIFEFILNYFNIWGYDDLMYFLGVPVFIVLTWAVCLTIGYSIVKKFQKKYKWSLLKATTILYIPAILIIETIGSQILKVVLNVDYPSLFPLTGCCKAPLLLYVAYYLVALFAFKGFQKI